MKPRSVLIIWLTERWKETPEEETTEEETEGDVSVREEEIHTTEEEGEITTETETTVAEIMIPGGTTATDMTQTDRGMATDTTDRGQDTEEGTEAETEAGTEEMIPIQEEEVPEETILIQEEEETTDTEINLVDLALLHLLVAVEALKSSKQQQQ